jgi:hypothetical protein
MLDNAAARTFRAQVAATTSGAKGRGMATAPLQDMLDQLRPVSSPPHD